MWRCVKVCGVWRGVCGGAWRCVVCVEVCGVCGGVWCVWRCVEVCGGVWCVCPPTVAVEWWEQAAWEEEEASEEVEEG